MRFVTAKYQLKLKTNQLSDKQMCCSENTSLPLINNGIDLHGHRQGHISCHQFG